MKIIQKFTTNNDCYKKNEQIVPTGLMLHSVGCAQSSAAVFNRTWNKKGIKVAVHAVIDSISGEIIQCLPWTMRGWHAGGSANDTHIGVEMCESKHITYTKGSQFTVDDLDKAQKEATVAYKSAVDLFAYLCKNYNLNPEKDIISHKEGHKLGIASGHVDPDHYWKGLKLPFTMDSFRKDVRQAMTSIPVGSQKKVEPVANTVNKNNSKEIWDSLIDYGFSKTGASGIMGNMMAESGLNPKNLQNSFNKKLNMSDEDYTNKVDDKTYTNFVHDGAGYGLVQWTFRTRKQALLKYCKDRNKSIGDLKTQIDFFLEEISGYRGLVEKLKQNISLYDATKLVLTIYEKPADMSEKALKKRLTYAQEYYNIFVTEHLFRVRQEWTMTGTQKGAYKNLGMAVALAKKYGYKVFDENGNCVYS